MNDFIRDTETGEPLIKDGDFVIADSTQQHQRDLLVLQKGELKQFPTIGVGVEDFLDDENPADLLREIRKQLSQDGMNVKDLSIGADGTINIDASYE